MQITIGASKRKEKVYLSGSITHKKDAKKDFERVEKFLKGIGYEVKNPMSSKKEMSYKEYMREDLKMLLGCDYIYFVNDITTSKGAFVEQVVAMTVGIPRLSLQIHANDVMDTREGSVNFGKGE